MGWSFLSFDAFGTYGEYVGADNPIDAIITRFEQAKVLHENVQRIGGYFDLKYLDGPRAKKIIKEEGERFQAKKTWNLRAEVKASFEKHLENESLPDLIWEILDDVVKSACLAYALPYSECTRCKQLTPQAIKQEGECPECQTMKKERGNG